MNYYYPQVGSQSKALWVLDAMASNDKHASIIRDKTISEKPGVFWGLANNNFELVRQYDNQKLPYYFTDMPYWNRWAGNNRETCSWRVIPNALHCSWVEEYPDDRFKSLNIKIHEWRKTGSHILICPSSVTVNNFYNQANWLNDTVAKLKTYTDRPIKIRHKPRNNKTSGPLAATIPFEEDVKNAWAVVTLVSIAGVEAACLGVPVFCSSHSPCATLGNIDLLNIENPILNDRTNWANTLAYHQFTEQELRTRMFQR